MYGQMSKAIRSLLCILILFSANCGQEKSPADIAPSLKDLPEFAGQWNLQGVDHELGNASSNVLFLDIEQKKAMLGKEEYALEMDSLGLRIKASDREQAVGYFLFSEIKEHTWVGIWEDRIIRLLR